MTGSWLIHWQQPPNAPALLCLAEAGAGGGQFRQWQKLAGESVGVLAVQLPGRENRWTEPPAATVDEVVSGVLAELPQHVVPGRPLVIFGNSFGGLLAYEIAGGLARLSPLRPRALVVAACRPPHDWDGAGRGLRRDELSDLLDMRGLGADDLDSDSRELMLQVLRDDARMSESYRHDARRRVDCALHAWGGTYDHTVPTAQLNGWKPYSTGMFVRRDFPGGHQFTRDQSAEVVASLIRIAHAPTPESRP